METANTAIDITRIKNADRLSIKIPFARKGEPGRSNVYVSPKITEIENTIPIRAAIAALMKAVYVHSRSFLFSMIDEKAPVR